MIIILSYSWLFLDREKIGQINMDTKSDRWFVKKELLKIEVLLVYNVVLISAAQQTDSVTHIYTLFLFHFFKWVYPQHKEFPRPDIEFESQMHPMLKLQQCQVI